MTTALLLALAGAAFGTVSPLGPQGHLATPKSGKGPGVLVLHPWWGLNADVKAFCDRLAREGFVAFAPDLFHGKVATTIPEAEALVKAHEKEYAKVQAEVAAASKYLSARAVRPSVAVVGFSFGAYYALHLSNADPDRISKCIVFYGTGQEDFSKSKAAYLGHFAEMDSFEPKEAVESLGKLLKDASRPAIFYTYPGTGHWFFEPSRPDAYNPDAADLAWRRSLEFLKG